MPAALPEPSYATDAAVWRRMQRGVFEKTRSQNWRCDVHCTPGGFVTGSIVRSSQAHAEKWTSCSARRKWRSSSTVASGTAALSTTLAAEGQHLVLAGQDPAQS